MFERTYKIFVVKLDGTDHLRDLSVGAEYNIQIDLKETYIRLNWHTIGSNKDNFVKKVMKFQASREAEMSN
jgi:hypothetical protein